MTREKAIELLKKLQADGDPETCHMAADDILCELLVSLGYEDVVAEYDVIGKWYA